MRANTKKNEIMKVSRVFHKKLRKMGMLISSLFSFLSFPLLSFLMCMFAANLSTQPSEKDLQEAMKQEIEEKKKGTHVNVSSFALLLFSLLYFSFYYLF